MATMVGRKGINGENVARHVGKGSTEEALPSRMVLSELTKGDPTQRSLNNYAKNTPGVAPPETQSILDMGKMSHGGPGISNRTYADKR